MKRLERNLRESSVEAFILALELINKLSVQYRLEAFVLLFCNAWELLMKAALVAEGHKVFYRKRRKQPRRSLSLDDCLKRLFTDARDPIRLNIEKVEELRNSATHLVVPFVPPDVMGLFQAGVINYATKLREWCNIDLAERIPLGMMALVYDFDPKTQALDSPAIRRHMTADTFSWIREFQHSVRTQADALAERRDSFYIPVDLRLAIVRNPKKADIVLGAGPGGREAIVVRVPKDFDKTHPHRQKEVLEELARRLVPSIRANQYDILCVRRVYGVDARSRWFYKPKFASPQYSEGFVDWLVKKAEGNPEFFKRARQRYRKQQGR